VIEGTRKAGKILRCDNAGENARPLRALCEEHGITIKFTAPDTPQQNGVVERRITVLTQRANVMMMAANLNEEGRKIIWAAAINTVNVLENITLTSAKIELQHTSS
jgi:transposase InsO family protein